MDQQAEESEDILPSTADISLSRSDVEATAEASVTAALATAAAHVAEEARDAPVEYQPAGLGNMLPGTVKMGNFPTMFGRILENDVIFCIDTSGSMYNVLDAVKEHLIETLLQLAYSDSDVTFNLIEFSTEVTQWSDKMVRCTPQTVAVAAQWVKNLQPKTGTNTLDALLNACSDTSCQGIYILTDGLPDQHSSDILDHVVYATQNRPIHSYYLQESNPDPRATKFLQDIAMETYGSFHVVSVTKHGAIERVTPVYRADCSAERIIRTPNHSIYPSNYKACSMAATIPGAPYLADPHPHPPVVYPDHYYSQVHPYYLYPWPFRHYYRYYSPNIGWSRFRTAKGWMKQAQSFVDGYSALPSVPGPGAMLIGTKVLVRRYEDGLFYIGTVKNQIMNNKFLVELGPCKHGKYRDTSYQETFVYDIVSYDDASRHAILPGDKVLAPWEPEGERYGPGVVIEGQEKRQAEGGGPDMVLVVSFQDGKTVDVAQDTALWIPETLHDRITFELQLPPNVRHEFAEQEYYPGENLPGYPVSGPVAAPVEYEHYEPAWGVGHDAVTLRRGVYNSPYYVPLSPVYYKYQPKTSAVKSEDIDKMIPGTELTKSELNEKVMSQLMQHKMLLGEQQQQHQRDRQRLLNKRENIEENSLKKSVSFAQNTDYECDYEAGDLDMKDSGRGSQEDEELYLTDIEVPDEEKRDQETQTRKSSADEKMFYRHRRIRRKVDKQRPMWKYWKNENAPEMMEPNNIGPYKRDPYDGMAVAAPLELRQHRVGPTGVEWATSMTNYVDPFAPHNYDPTVVDSMHIPRPPPKERIEKQGPGCDISDALGQPPTHAQSLAEGRQQYRKQQVLNRRQDWDDHRQEAYHCGQLMQDQHRERVAGQLARDQQRHQDEHERLARQREAKKAINSDIRQRIQERQDWQQQREDQRLDVRRENRERREEIRAQREVQVAEKQIAAQVAREERVHNRWGSVEQKMSDEVSQKAARDLAARRAKIDRIHHFRQLEADGQKKKVLTSQVFDQNRAIHRSYVLP